MIRKRFEEIAKKHKAEVIIFEDFLDDSIHAVIRWKHPKDGTALDAMILKNREDWNWDSYRSSNPDVIIKRAIKHRNEQHAILEGL